MKKKKFVVCKGAINFWDVVASMPGGKKMLSLLVGFTVLKKIPWIHLLEKEEECEPREGSFQIPLSRTEELHAFFQQTGFDKDDDFRKLRPGKDDSFDFAGKPVYVVDKGDERWAVFVESAQTVEDDELSAFGQAFSEKLEESKPKPQTSKKK